MNSPILLLVFNRPDCTKIVFEAIKKAKPKKLYVAADGPRKERPDEILACDEVRRIVADINWECELKVLFNDSNAGCKKAVSNAISWFFENETEGIILEDDCIPSSDFFNFCDILLSKYRNDTRVWQICGTTYFPKAVPEGSDYFFSRYGPIWGWATWRRAWKNYDPDLVFWDSVKNSHILQNVYLNKYELRYKTELANKLCNGEINTWDYQWGFCKNFNSGLSIIPKSNLIQNIGFDEFATHTNTMDKFTPQYYGEINSKLLHPKFIVPDIRYDKYYAKKMFKGSGFMLKKIIKKILNR